MKKDAPSSAESIASRLIWLRCYYDLQWNEFGKSVGASPAKISNWVNGTGRLSIDGALRICDVYNVSLDFLYRGKADNLPHDMRKAWLTNSQKSFFEE